jgi:hypothetical protein
VARRQSTFGLKPSLRTILLVLSILVLLPAASFFSYALTNGTTIDLKTSNGTTVCPKSPLSGSWNSMTSTCTLPTPSSLPVGTTLKIESGVTLAMGTFTNFGTIQNSGIIAGNPAANLLTGPVFENEEGGVVNLQELSVTTVNGKFSNFGLFQTGGFNVPKGQTATNEEGGTFQNTGGNTNINGTFNNDGTFVTLFTGVDHPQVFVYGKLENNGIASLANAIVTVYSGGSITNNGPGEFTVGGTLTVNGTVENYNNFIVQGYLSLGKTGEFTTYGVTITNGTTVDSGAFVTGGAGLLKNLGTFNIENGVLTNFGVINNTGLIWNQGNCALGPRSGEISNAGTINNGGQITNGVGNSVCAKFDSIDFLNNTGTFTNGYYSEISDTVLNSGTMQLAAGTAIVAATFTNTASGSVYVGSQGESTLVVDGGTITNTGLVSLAAGSSMNMSSGELVNAETVTNGGTMRFSGSATVVNVGTLRNDGTIVWTSSAGFENEISGAINSDGNLTFAPSHVGVTSELVDDGTLVCAGYVGDFGIIGVVGQFNVTSGTFFIAPGAALGVFSGGSFSNFASTNNNGTIENSGHIANYGTLVSSIGTFTNDGGVTLEAGSVTVVDSVLYNQIISGEEGVGIYLEPGAILSLGGGSLINSGSLLNEGLIEIDATGSITNYGTFNNTNLIENGAGGGNLTNMCDGIMVGGGTIDNPPLTQACATPTISYPKKGNVTYGSIVINGTSNPLAQITIYSGTNAVATTTANST